jgi:hypothetical protein
MSAFENRTISAERLIWARCGRKRNGRIGATNAKKRTFILVRTPEGVVVCSGESVC